MHVSVREQGEALPTIIATCSQASEMKIRQAAYRVHRRHAHTHSPDAHIQREVRGGRRKRGIHELGQELSEEVGWCREEGGGHVHTLS